MSAGVTNPQKLNPGDQARADRAAGEYGALVRAAASGDRPAMERLLMRAQEVAYRFSLLVCGHADEAEDVMQEALLKTYRYASTIREPDAFRTWLYRTVRNSCLLRRRKRAHEPARVLSLDDMLPGADGHDRPIDVRDARRGPDEVAMNRALRRRLRQALKALPTGYRLIVFLREMEGLSTREVAEVVGLSEANVKTRLHRARLFLQRQLVEP